MKMTSFELLKNLDIMSALTSYVSFINEILFTVSKENATVLYFLNGSPQGGRGGGKATSDLGAGVGERKL